MTAPDNAAAKKSSSSEKPRGATARGAKGAGTEAPRNLPAETKAAPAPKKVAPAKVPAKPSPVVKLTGIPPQSVPRARPKRRHRLLMLSFFVMVLLPAGLAAAYLYFKAEDRFASTAAFSVRREEGTGAADLFTGLGSLGMGSMNTPDANILHQFIQSQGMVEAADAALDLRKIYSLPHKTDPLFAFDPAGTREELVGYWESVVSLIFEPDIGLITLEVQAFRPEDARAVAQFVLDESAALINDLSAIARDDTMRLAREELDEAGARLKEMRLEMSKFRDIEQIVDPTADLAGQMGVITALQQSLAEAMVRRDLLVGTTTDDDPRIQQADRTIEAVRARIADERQKIGAAQAGAEGDPLSRVVGAYESLVVDREFAEQSYLAARVAYETAVAEARRTSRYLAVHIRPTMAESAIYPRRLTLTVVATVFLSMVWVLFVLIAYSIRDRR